MQGLPGGTGGTERAEQEPTEPETKLWKKGIVLVAIGAACLLAPRPRKAPRRRDEPRRDPEPAPGRALSEPSAKEPVLTERALPEAVPPRDDQSPAVVARQRQPEFILTEIRPHRKGRMKAVFGSTIVHGALTAALWISEPAAETYPGMAKYRVQILHLQPSPQPEVAAKAAAGQLWNTLHKLSANRSSVPQAGHVGGVRRKSPAPQTLIVDSAPPDLKLNQAIPLPIAVSWTALAPLPPAQERVRLDAPQRPLAEPVRPPAVKVISLPDPVQQAPDATAIPKVSQSAAPDSQSGESAGPARAHVTAGELAGVRVQDAGANAGVFASTVNPSPDSITVQPAPVQPATAQPGPADSGAGDSPLARIDLPPGGKPRTAILGESPQMPGRIVATVYVRMGLRKNWILEYWSQSSTAALDAPWPYTMFRPNLTLPAEADALLVRGRLNTEGRLEQLTMLAPAQWTQKDSLFRALEQWKFRAAAKNGQPVAVEVLLVIPRQDEE